MRVSKWISTAFALSLAAGAVAGLTGSPAFAAGGNSCKTFRGYATFSPGITSKTTNQTITVHGTVGGCSPSSSTGGAGTVVGTIKTTKPGSCTTLVQGGGVQKGTSVTNWKNGKSSHFSITVTEGTGSSYNLASIVGKVTSGQFAGKKVSGQVKFTPVGKGACVSAPLKKVTFAETKPFGLS